MEFKKYQHIERFGTTEVQGIEIGTCFIYPKIDGCFNYDAQVILSDGTSERIGKIVNQKIDAEVLSYDKEKKKIVPKKIVNWYKYNVDKDKINEEWVTIGVDKNGTQLKSIASRRVKVRVTKNHLIFVKRNNEITEIPAGEINVGDIVLVPSQKLSVIQEQVLLGGLLGDSSAFPNDDKSRYNGISFGHSIKQKEYILYKHHLLGEMAKDITEIYCSNSYGKEKIRFNTVCDKRSQQAYDLCYQNKKKIVTENWVNRLNTLGLAIWYMDDGSLITREKSYSVVFHVEGFDINSQETLVSFLNKKGYDAHIAKSGIYNIIVLSVEGSDRFFTDVSQHIIESMQYKLPPRFRGRFVKLDDDIDVETCLLERKVKSVEKGIGVDCSDSTIFYNGYYKYDIEIEGNHNYFCNGILVHNSNSSAWLNDEGEICGGSRNRQLTLEKDNAGFYAWLIEQENIIGYLRKHPMHRLYGEWLVPHTLKTYRKDAWRRFYVFDVAIDRGEGQEYLPYNIYQPLLEEFEIDYIPPIKIVKNASYEDFVYQMMNNNTFLIEDGKGVGEGIVIKNYNWYNQYHRQTWAKIVTSEFKEKHIKTMGAPATEHTLLEEKIAEEYVTEALVEKEYAKIVNEKGGWQSKYIPMLLGVVWNCVITEEMWNIIKKYKNPTISFRTLNAFVINRVKEIKKEIF